MDSKADRDFQALFNLGASQLIVMRWAEAALTFEICTGRDPAFAPAWANLATAYFRLGRTNEAIDAAQRSTKLAPDSSGGWMALAGAYLTASRFKDALDPARKAAKLDPGPATLGAIALAYDGLQDYEKAYKAARRVQNAVEGFDPIAGGIAADALRMLGKENAALKAYDRVINGEGDWTGVIIGEPPVNRALRGKGLLLYQRGISRRRVEDLREAAECFEEATERNRRDYRSWAGIGMTRRQLGAFAASLEAIEMAIKLFEKDAFLALERGQSLLELRRLDEAVSDLEFALERFDPQDSLRSTAINYRAVALQMMGRHSECIVACTAALDEGIDNPIIRNARALALLSGGKLDEAEADLARAREIDPQDPVIIGNLAVIALERKDPEAAEKLFEQARSMSPNYPYILSARHHFLVTQGRYEDAEELVAEIRERLSDKPELLARTMQDIKDLSLETALHAANTRVEELEAAAAAGQESSRHLRAQANRLADFERILAKNDVQEEEVKQFLKSESSRFLFGPQAVAIHTEHELGSDFVCDFVVEFPQERYLLVEIENPKHKVFTRGGQRSAPVTHACQQVEDWQQWIEENNPYAQKKLPGCMSPEGLVLIGRSDSMSQDDRTRLKRANVTTRGLLTISTYDDLLADARAVIKNLEAQSG